MSYILIADDDQQTLLLLRAALKKVGYPLELAADGQEAVDRALAARPALIIMDVAMPRKTGLEATREIKAHYGADAPPVLLITALGMRSMVQDGMASGADDYMLKPFALAAFLDKVAALLRGG